jgi:hypothetical protein
VLLMPKLLVLDRPRAARAGLRARLLSPEPLSRGIEMYTGLLEPHGGHLHPWKGYTSTHVV